jgi:hypothetical protein
MALVHNTFIRSLNAIYLQGPHVHSSTDIADFLFYCHAWVISVSHHHEAEEETFFPLVREFTGKPEMVEKNLEQHQAFHDGLQKFDQYATTTPPEQYDWTVLKTILDGFAEHLIQHLKDEIPTILALDQYDNDGVKKIWDATIDAAKNGEQPPHLFVRIHENLLAGSSPC